MSKPKCWVTEAKQILPYVKATLDKLGFSHLNPRMDEWDEGIDLGDNICMHVESDQKFERGFLEKDSRGIYKPSGYTLRAERTGDLEEIALKEGEFCAVLNYAGHELGHVLTPPVREEEEEKAYAFAFAWIKAIVEHKIVSYTKCGVSLAIACSEPQNEPHKSANRFVKKLIISGHDPLQLYWDIANKKVRNWKRIGKEFMWSFIK